MLFMNNTASSWTLISQTLFAKSTRVL
jgi:hypothetical protein